MNTLLLVFILLLVLKLSTSIVLDLLNLRYAQARSSEVPESFRDFIDLPTYQKSVEYTVAKTRFGIVSDLYDAGVLVLVLLLGVLPWFFELFTAWFGFGVWGQALVLFLIGLVLGYLRFLLTGGAPSILKNVSALTKARKNYGSLIR
jgi:STE24 endopeptidase